MVCIPERLRQQVEGHREGSGHAFGLQTVEPDGLVIRQTGHDPLVARGDAERVGVEGGLQVIRNRGRSSRGMTLLVAVLGVGHASRCHVVVFILYDRIGALGEPLVDLGRRDRLLLTGATSLRLPHGIAMRLRVVVVVAAELAGEGHSVTDRAG